MTPQTNDKYLGIEIELISPISDESQIEEQLMLLDLQDMVAVGTDGSIRTGNPTCGWCGGDGEYYNGDYNDYEDCECNKGYGWELKVLVKESDLFRVTTKLATLFRNIKAKVNDTCGLHVHLDMRNRNPVESAKRLLNAQGLMFKTMPKSRRNNEYCMPVVKRYVGDVMQIGKYHAIHTKDTYQYRKTIEVRLHEGTVDSREIYNWCKFLINIVDTQVADKIVRVPGIKKFPTPIKNYLQRRISHV